MILGLQSYVPNKKTQIQIFQEYSLVSKRNEK